MNNKVIEKEKILVNFCKRKLTKGKKLQFAGRNFTGQITVRHKGGGHKRLLRIIDFKKVFWDIYGVVLRFVYDPNRTAPLVLICYLNGIMSYQVASAGLKIGSTIYVGEDNKNIKIKGTTLPLYKMQDGMLINNIELHLLKGGQFVRAAGTSAQLLKVNYIENFSLIRLPSKEERLINQRCIATVGQVADFNSFLVIASKAGFSRHLGIRPTVRGVAMNPIDHPHGGGQGKTSGAGGRRSQVTFKGKVAKTQPTRSKKKKTLYIIFSRKKKYLKN